MIIGNNKGGKMNKRIMTDEEARLFIERCKQRRFEKKLKERVRREDNSVIYRNISTIKKGCG